MAGPAEELRPLLAQLQAEGVFVRELDTRGAAFHSPALTPSLPALRACKCLLLAPVPICIATLSHHSTG